MVLLTRFVDAGASLIKRSSRGKIKKLVSGIERKRTTARKSTLDHEPTKVPQSRHGRRRKINQMKEKEKA
jgi:hypothetical protein